MNEVWEVYEKILKEVKIVRLKKVEVGYWVVENNVNEKIFLISMNFIDAHPIVVNIVVADFGKDPKNIKRGETAIKMENLVVKNIVVVNIQRDDVWVAV